MKIMLRLLSMRATNEIHVMHKMGLWSLKYDFVTVILSIVIGFYLTKI